MSDEQSLLAAALESVGVEASIGRCSFCANVQEECPGYHSLHDYAPVLLPLPDLVDKAEGWIREDGTRRVLWLQEIARELTIEHCAYPLIVIDKVLEMTIEQRAKCATAAIEKVRKP